MPIWVTAVIIPLAIASANIFALFYFKWVPNVESQKRQLKRAGAWVIDILTLVTQGAALYVLTLVKGPVTPRFVVEAALVASGAVACAILIVFRRWVLGGLFEKALHNFGRLLDNTDQTLENTSRHIAITGRHRDALVVIAGDPNLSTETVNALQTLLDGGGQPDAASLRLRSGAPEKKARKPSR